MNSCEPKCAICKQDVEGRPWILLNRYVCSSGQSYVINEVLNEYGNYAWDVVEEPDGEAEDDVTGTVLCFPQCMVTYLEGQMIQADIEQGLTT